MTKEEFLQKYGVQVQRGSLLNWDCDDHSETCVICLVDNGQFTAAGILYGQGDLLDFTDPSDLWPKKFYIVHTTAINAEGGPSKEVS